MKNLILLLVGAALGAAVTHQLTRTEQGQRFVLDLDRKAREFGAAVAEGYHAREAELRGEGE